MNAKARKSIILKRYGLICGLFSGIVLALVGCTSIYDNVPINRPGVVDPYQRNQLDKCAPHVYPNRLIRAEMGTAVTVFQSGVPVQDQPVFDFCWNNVTPSLDPEHQQTYSLKPVIDWDHENVFFLPMYLSNSCEKVKSEGMKTDCYNITISVYKYVEGENCASRNTNPVYIYIYPKTGWPILTRWLKTPSTATTPGT